MAVSEGHVIPPSFTASTLKQCCFCSRSFIPASLDKHEKICQRTFINKRKVFNSQNQRIQNEKAVLSAGNKQKEQPVQNDTYRKTRWREKHEVLISTIKAARGVASAQKEGKPLPPPPRSLIPSDYIMCEYCQRHFSPKSADRHIEWCKEQNTRISQNTKVAAAARERLEARTKYKAPTLRKKSTNVKKANTGKPPVNGSLIRETEPRSSGVRVRGQSISPPHKTDTSDHRRSGTNSKMSNNFAVAGMSNYKHNLNGNLNHERNSVQSSKHSSTKENSRQSYNPYTAAEQQMRDLLEEDNKGVSSRDHSRQKYHEHRSTGLRSSTNNQLPINYQKATSDATSDTPHLRRSTIQVRDKPSRTGPGRRSSRHTNNLLDTDEESQTRYSERGSGDLRSTYTLITSSDKVNQNNSRHLGSRRSAASQDSDRISMQPRRNTPSPPLKLPSAVTMNNNHHHHHHWPHGHSTARAYEQHDQRLSTSSSDSSLPPLNNQRHNNKNKRNGQHSMDGWTACFCHECGTCFPVATAKFCCECGTRRICSI